jgi:hypothetical protein
MLTGSRATLTTRMTFEVPVDDEARATTIEIYRVLETYTGSLERADELSDMIIERQAALCSKDWEAALAWIVWHHAVH